MIAIQESQLKNERQWAKTEAALASLIERQAKTDEQLAKTDAQLAKTDAQIAATEAQLAKTDAQLALTDAQLARNAAQLLETKRIVSGIGINLGDVAEDFFGTSLQEKKMLGNVPFDAVALQLKAHKGKIQDEFDVVMYNGHAIGIVEVKHKVHPADIEKLISGKLPNFRKLFPQYAAFDFYLGIAGMSIPKDAREMAEKAGLAVLRQKGDVLQMNTNLKAF
jgi:multidrug efflux pump subunit AcrA (membrane-fusion protein)